MCKYLHRAMRQGTQGLNTKFFFLATGFHQCVVVVKENNPLAFPNNDAATRSSNESV